MSVRRATTILLLRGGAEDLEVFMVQRHRKSGFLPNAWVFPGGRVDPGDAVASHPNVNLGEGEVLRQLSLPHREALAHVVAGVRETWEEAGVWLGTGALPADQRDVVASGRRGFLEVLEEAGATLEVPRLRAWSWWVTPAAEPKRYDTRFLVASVEGRGGRHDDRETVDSAWVRPAEVLQRSQEAFPLAPPTWWTLQELAAFGSAVEAFEAASTRPAHLPVQPIMRFEEEGMSLLLPGHADHPAAAVPGLPEEITLEAGRWVGWTHGRAARTRSPG